MAQKADGTLYIETAIEKDGFIAGGKEVEAACKRMAKTISGIGNSAKVSLKKQTDAFIQQNQQYAQQQQKVEALKNKLKELSNQKVKTKSYADLEKQFVKLDTDIARLIEKQERFLSTGGRRKSTAYKRMEYDLEQLSKKQEKVLGRMDALERSGGAYTKPDTGAMDAKLTREKEKLLQMNHRLGTSYENLKAKMKGYAGQTGKASGITQSLKKRMAGLAGHVKKGTKALFGMDRQTKNTRMSMGRMLATSILFSTVFRAISAITGGIGEGLQNLAQYSDSANASISSLKSALTRLKNSFAAAFAPILSVVAPYLTTFINLISKALTYVGMFVAALTGQNTFTKAVGVQEDYAAGLRDTADSAQDAADGIETAAEAAESYLSPIDEINKVQKSIADIPAGGAGGGSNPGSGPSIGDMFETVKIENSIAKLADKVKDILSNIFDVFKAAWDNKGSKVLSSAKDALKSISDVAKSIAKTFYDVFTNGTGQRWVESLLERLRSMLDVIKAIASAFSAAWNSGAGYENVTALFVMLTNINDLIVAIRDSFSRAFSDGTGVKIWTNILGIVTGVYNIVGNLAKSIQTAWDTAGVGDRIWSGILNSVNVILQFIHDIADATAEWAANLDFYPLLDSIANLFEGLSPLLETIGSVLYNIYTTIILPIAKFLIEEALPTLLNILGSFFTFLSEHQWIIEAIGAALIGAFAASKLVPIITTVINAISGIIGTVRSLLGVLSGGGGLSSVISMIVSALGGPLTLAIAAVVAALVLLITHWDDVKAAFSDFKEDIVNKWTLMTTAIEESGKALMENVKALFGKIQDVCRSFGDWLNSAFEKDWRKEFGILGGVVEGFFKTVKNLMDAGKETFGGLITFLQGVFTGNWRQAWEGIKSIFKGVWDTFASIVKAPINIIIGLINGLLYGVQLMQNGIASALNSLSINLPGWVEDLTGYGSIGFNIGRWTAPQIPYLATGAVIPPNAPFMAVLGDQKSGNNIEAPESLLRKLIREEAGAFQKGGGDIRLSVYLNRRTVYEEIIEEAKLRQLTSGRNPFELG